MKIHTTPIPDVWVIEPQVFSDSRGYFFESYHRDKFKQLGINANFIQDNESLSHKNIVRGLHFQAPPYAQGKLVRVAQGKVYDVCVDIRKNSPTYGKYFGIELSAENHLMLWIPEGFAHGFSVLEDNTLFLYKCTNIYHRGTEGGILWNDPTLGIDWKVDNPIVSEKDKQLPTFDAFISPFE
ncbi:MAG: dTDP-4-dehydrorhamnose 3,5-epimerase [Bacteroidia bacterium]|nr:dTDP-4-dehydrorhamnose 3,5-epimerase [Bacteroidia bacterium]MDW8346434.1 dTDP-4-dehydrorhamnose 3,5-epimerase [Bacteroidia bacterium]